MPYDVILSEILYKNGKGVTLLKLVTDPFDKSQYIVVERRDDNGIALHRVDEEVSNLIVQYIKTEELNKRIKP